MNNFSIVGDLLRMKFLSVKKEEVHDIIQAENLRLFLQKYVKTVQELRHKNHNCHVISFSGVFFNVSLPSCDTSFNRTVNSWEVLTGCSERVKHVIQRKVTEYKKLLLTSFIP